MKTKTPLISPLPAPLRREDRRGSVAQRAAQRFCPFTRSAFAGGWGGRRRFQGGRCGTDPLLSSPFQGAEPDVIVVRHSATAEQPRRYHQLQERLRCPQEAESMTSVARLSPSGTAYRMLATPRTRTSDIGNPQIRH